MTAKPDPADDATEPASTQCEATIRLYRGDPMKLIRCILSGGHAGPHEAGPFSERPEFVERTPAEVAEFKARTLGEFPVSERPAQPNAEEKIARFMADARTVADGLGFKTIQHELRQVARRMIRKGWTLEPVTVPASTGATPSPSDIEHLQERERVVKLGEFLEGLQFWPSPTADQNLARDAGRLLQGKPCERSTGLDESFRLWGGPVLPMQRCIAELETEVERLRAEELAAVGTEDEYQLRGRSLWQVVHRESAGTGITWRCVHPDVAQLLSVPADLRALPYDLVVRAIHQHVAHGQKEPLLDAISAAVGDSRHAIPLCVHDWFTPGIGPTQCSKCGLRSESVPADLRALVEKLTRAIDVIDRNISYPKGQRPLGWTDLISARDELDAALGGSARQKPTT